MKIRSPDADSGAGVAVVTVVPALPKMQQQVPGGAIRRPQPQDARFKWKSYTARSLHGLTSNDNPVSDVVANHAPDWMALGRGAAVLRSGIGR